MSDLDNVLLDEFKERELEILSLMAAGYTNAAIGRELFITKETVRWYNKQIYSKLGTSRRTEAIAKAQRLALISPPGVESSTADPSAAKHNLPHLNTPFLGRATELDKLTDFLTQPHTRLVTLLGPGGMGKTRLAVELGRKLLEQFTDGVYLFELAALTNADAIVSTALDALQSSSKENVDQKRTLFDYCRQKKMLLIFDNFEHLLDGATLVDDLLKATADLGILVTSRERLNVYGETVYELTGLQTSGRDLFIASAQTLQPDFQPQLDEQETIQHIVTLVGGLPLGIILAAAWVDMLTVSEIAAEIGQDLDMLSTEMRNLPERQRSIRTVLNASWQKLSLRERKACMALAIFQGGFSRTAAKKVASAPLPILQKLQHKSFIQRTAERRYDFHPLVYQFTKEQLEISGQLAETHQTHLTYFHTYVKETLLPFDHGDAIHPLKQIALDHDNIRLALDWGLGQTSCTNEVSALTLSMTTYWDNRSYPQEADHYLQLALKQTANAEQKVLLLLKHSRFLGKLGRLPQAEKELQHALTLVEPLNNALLQLDALAALTVVLAEQAHYQEVIHHAQTYLQLSRELNNRKHEARALSRLANTYFFLGDSERCEAFNRQSLQLAHECEDDVGVARITYNLALNHYKEGRLAQARPLFEESLSLKRLIGDRAGMADRLSMLSQLNSLEGEYTQAAAHLEEAFTLAQEVNEPKRMLFVLEAYGLFYELQETWSDAISYQRQRLDLARELHHQRALMYAPLDLARMYLRLNLIEQARHYLLQSIEKIVEKGSSDEYALALFVLSDYFQATADYDQSGRLYAIYLQSDSHDIELARDYTRLRHTLQTNLSAAEWDKLQHEAVLVDLKPLVEALGVELSQRSDA